MFGSVFGEVHLVQTSAGNKLIAEDRFLSFYKLVTSNLT